MELWGDEVEAISIINPVSGQVASKVGDVAIYPAKHFVTPEHRLLNAVREIRKELDEQLAKFNAEGKLLEAQRLNARVRFDIEMLQEVGHCPGIENYSRHCRVSSQEQRQTRFTISFQKTFYSSSMNRT